MTEFKEIDSEELRLKAKTTRFKFKNPKHPEISDLSVEDKQTRPSILKPDEYEALRRIREDYGVNLTELLGEYLRAVYMYHEHEDESYIDMIVGEIDDIHEIKRFTNWKVEKAYPKVSEVVFRNAKHPDNEDVHEDGPEHKWYKATRELRNILGADIYLIVGEFLLAVDDVVESGDKERIHGIQERLKR